MTLPWWLDVWVRWQSNDAAEIRQLWYPAHTPALTGGWARGETFWEDQEGEQDAALAQAVDLAVDALPKDWKELVLWAAGLRRGERPPGTFADAVSAIRSVVLAKGFAL